LSEDGGPRNERSRVAGHSWFIHPLELMTMHVKAPAKINLFLHVVGRRGDGYHELQTVFQFIDLCDEIELFVRQDGRVERAGLVEGVPPQADLAVRAAWLLKQTSGTPLGAEISLVKRIPMGAGLGGGSSDAAAVLLSLNRMWDVKLSTAELEALAVGLGADVPVFVRGKAAWAEGVGESLTEVVLPEAWYLVVVPNCRVSTASVFAEATLTRNSTPLRILDCLRYDGSVGYHETDVESLLERTRNDCEGVVRALYKPVDDAWRWLSAYGRPRMSGTGSAVFVRCSSGSQASELLRRVPPEWRGYAVKGLNRSPALLEDGPGRG
jgi:4-diphosphocytidyl-2-C-methyl-D-erythritol kinase